jgi:hypothetical protein
MPMNRRLFLVAFILANWLAEMFSPSASAQPVQLEGGFSPATAIVDGHQNPHLLRRTRLWDSWEGDERRTGRFVYGPFVPGRTLELYVAGWPVAENKEIYLETVQSGQRLVLRPRTAPGNCWVRLRWSLPAPWAGHVVRLVAVDQATDAGGWVGISAPLKSSWQLKPAVEITGLQAGVFVLLLLPGLAFVLMRPASDPLRTLAWVLTVSAISAYAIFFVYFARPAMGHKLSWAILGVCLGCLILRRRKLAAEFRRAEFAIPLLFALIATAFYSVGGFLYGGVEAPGALSFDRFLPSLPPDPLLPHMLAEKLARGEPLRPFFIDWLTSDRPPLQAGMNLLLWPIVSKELGYVAIGVAAQGWVWIGLWIFLRRLGASYTAVSTIFAGAVFSGFFFLNSFFCWPKLLPTAFLLIAAGFLWGRPRRQLPTSGDALLAGSGAVLSLLGHGGSAFAVAGIAAVYLLERRRLNWQPLVLGLLSAVIIWLPWHWYQKYCDPPGDRLVKYHLAGHEAIDPRSSWVVIREAYAQLNCRQILENKLVNFRMLVWGNGDVAGNLAQARAELREGRPTDAFWRTTHCLREAGFFHYFQTLGPLLLGVPGLAWLSWRRRQRPEWLAARTSLALGLATIVIWCLLMFKGGSTVIHQSSYLIGACAYVLVGLGLAVIPCWLRFTALAINFGWFVCVWVLAPEYTADHAVLFPAAFPGFWLVWSVIAAALVACLNGMTRLDPDKLAGGQPTSTTFPGNSNKPPGAVVE